MRTRLTLVVLCLTAAAALAEDLVPITTSSPEAKAAYLRARGKFENLRNADARADLQAAVAADPQFAMAWLGLAQTATSTKEFFDNLAHAVALIDKVSPAERLWIQGVDAGAKGQPDVQWDCYRRLARDYPADPRVLNLVGIHHFGQQDWASASAAFEAATRLDPAFSPAYNMLGYALRFAGDMDGAEHAFRTYITLIPDDPNPYDSYAEFLLKVGRYEESIAAYRQALAQDPHFQASQLGIATDLNLLGRHAEARAGLQASLAQARNDGERRGVWFATAVSWLDEGQDQPAIAAIATELALAARIGDVVAMAGDHTNIATIHLEAGGTDPGRLAQAEAHFAAALAVVEASDRDEKTKDGWRRGDLYNCGRLAVARGDLAAARELTAQLLTQSQAAHNPFAVRLAHELAGIAALAAGAGEAALDELALANQQDPANLLRQAAAAELAGDDEAAARWRQRLDDFNGLNNLNYGLVRGGLLRAAP